MKKSKILILFLFVFMAGWLCITEATGVASAAKLIPSSSGILQSIQFHQFWNAASDKPISLSTSYATPPDPLADIPWSGGFSGVADIQTAFNNARSTENSQLGISIPMLTMPSQSSWDAKSNGEKALWLINRERIDRSVHALHGVESNVTGVAQYYAQYLIDHNAFSHNADGRDPWERLHDNPAIGACHDYLPIAENLAVFWTSGSSIALPVERAVYMWMYEDSGSSWGHRHTILYYPYTDNSGPSGKEGFLGIGVAGGPHSGWPYGEIIVMNVFDPCSTWNYGEQGEDILGTWPSGVWYRNSQTGAWVNMSGSSNLVAAGDLDGDGTDDLIGVWSSGLWVKYSSTSYWLLITSSLPTDIASGDMNGDGRDDILGTWPSGVWYRNSIGGSWVKMSNSANLVAAGDIDGDGTDDLIGTWSSGLWVKYSSTGTWAKLSTTLPTDIASGDMNGDGRDDVLGTWSSGVWYRNSIGGSWVKMSNSANLVAAGDIDGDGTDDLIGTWSSGLWVKNSSTASWQFICTSLPCDIDAGSFR